jgi:hypothetical protein
MRRGVKENYLRKANKKMNQTRRRVHKKWSEQEGSEREVNEKWSEREVEWTRSGVNEKWIEREGSEREVEWSEREEQFMRAWWANESEKRRECESETREGRERDRQREGYQQKLFGEKLHSQHHQASLHLNVEWRVLRPLLSPLHLKISIVVLKIKKYENNSKINK